jgi:hypothetical protein
MEHSNLLGPFMSYEQNEELGILTPAVYLFYAHVQNSAIVFCISRICVAGSWKSLYMFIAKRH